MRMKAMLSKEKFDAEGSGTALLLGVCDRTFRRYMNRHNEDGLDALLAGMMIHRDGSTHE